ncbi:MAG: hypothetical protein QXL94_06725 [Candidatus Parvarchaeum sp.]
MGYVNSYTENNTFGAFKETKTILKTLKIKFMAFFMVLFFFYYIIFSYYHFGLTLFGVGYYFYYMLASSFILAALGALSIAIGFYSQRIMKNSAKNNKIGVYAFFVSLVPSTMCCTPIIPSILVTLFGSGGIALISGSIQGVLSYFSPVFIAIAALLLYYSIRVSLKRMKNPSCKC